jgi:Major Facilitator Superfamily
MTGNPAESAIGKASRRLIPFLVLCYAVNFLDRVNVGFAALAMNEDLGFTPEVFGFGAGIFFAGYILFEVPSNLALARFGARIWIARIMISWGLVATAMAFVAGETSFYALRFALGVAEAGFFPGIILYLTYWFPREERARIVSLFMTAVPIATVVGGPLSGALLGLHGLGGIAGWRWLFIIEGIPAVLLGIVALKFLTDRPKDAHWLAPEERTALERRLEAEAEDTRASGYAGIGEALTNPRVIELDTVPVRRCLRLVGPCRAASACHARLVARHPRHLRRHRDVLVAADLDPDRHGCCGWARVDQLHRQLRWICRAGHRRPVERGHRRLHRRPAVPRRRTCRGRCACAPFRRERAAPAAHQGRDIADFG